MSSATQENMNRLYGDHHVWLNNYLKKQLTHRPDMASDIVQDTFLSLLEKPQAIPQIREQRAFLLTIAKRKLFNFWRKQDLEQTYLQSLQDYGVEESIPAEQLCMIQDALNRIDLLLDGLKPKVQHAFLLKKLELLTHPEIAQIMNLSLATVERYIKQATIHCLLQRKNILND
ncbi:sigma-70 family RNA polymerase sigma factor [Acinetobacter puyangensis]|uniref:RNA polymerase sigma-70 factor, ECF subfamily n=1 Tax=Acinetobacter puyangensis TaxID=1096779 RepID=A0A240E9U2_9GAMM|nr:sigma-70 family RNA polymerase sigma factor [Acinetobacter puyangensis]SNX45498.1 RNA polymerase sigma-70 factor, ECF subfamily [Acinetobacter puyangensis]